MFEQQQHPMFMGKRRGSNGSSSGEDESEKEKGDGKSIFLWSPKSDSSK